MAVRSRRKLLSSLAAVGQRVSDEQATPEWARGVLILVDWTATDGTETLAPGIQVKMPDGTWWAFSQAFTAFAAAATGRYFLVLYPSATVGVATQYQSKNAIVPTTWRFTMTPSANNLSHTYEAVVDFLP